MVIWRGSVEQTGVDVMMDETSEMDDMDVIDVMTKMDKTEREIGKTESDRGWTGTIKAERTKRYGTCMRKTEGTDRRWGRFNRQS